MPCAPLELRRGDGLNRQRIGDRGEALALRYLAKKGYTPVERNYRTRLGEIDLIVRDKGALVFPEYKAIPERPAHLQRTI